MWGYPRDLFWCSASLSTSFQTISITPFCSRAVLNDLFSCCPSRRLSKAPTVRFSKLTNRKAWVETHHSSPEVFQHLCRLHLNDSEIWDELDIALKEFQQGLSSEQEARFKSIATHTPKAEDVLQLTNEIVEKNAHRQSRVLADRVAGFLNSVQQFCNVIDTYAAANQIAALVWGSVKLIMLITLNVSEYFEKLSKCVAQLSTYCPRLSEYEKLFEGSLRLQRALLSFYAVIVIFCSKALSAVQEKGIQRFAKSLWKSFKVEFAELEERLSAAREEVNEEIKLASEQATYEFRRLQMIEIRENQVFRSHQRSALAEAQDRRIQKGAREGERRRVRILERIHNYDYNASLRKAQETRCEGTCLWLFQRVEFQEWINETPPGCLACYGIRKYHDNLTLFLEYMLTTRTLTEAGCGKTVLMGSVYDFLKRSVLADKDMAISYYFFDHSVKTSLLLPTFLRSILHQVLEVEKLLPSIQHRLEVLFPDGGQWAMNVLELETLFAELCGTLKRVFLLIDGLDEVDLTDRKLILTFLKKVQDIASVKVFVTAHPEVDVSAVFNECRTLKIEPQDIQPDITIFVESQIERRSHEELSECSPALLESIKQALISDAQGMFLWVDLQIKEICTAVEQDGTPDRIPDLLLSLPKTLEEIYDSAFRRLSHRSNQQLEQAKKVFQWLACARRPLSIMEIEEAITITADQKHWANPSIKLNPSKLCRLCANLVNFDQVRGRVSLAHHTVLDFLFRSPRADSMTSFRIDHHEAQCYLAEICIAYLGFVDFRRSLVQTCNMRNLENLNRPVTVLTPMLSSVPGLSAMFQDFSARHWGQNRAFDLVNAVRAEIGAHQPARINPSFQLLEYCRIYWADHSRHLPLDNWKTINSLKSIIFETNLPFEWKPWGLESSSQPITHWKMFSWAVRQSHTLLLRIWLEEVPEVDIIKYWMQLWSQDGPTLFESTCDSGNSQMLDFFLEPRKGQKLVRPSPHEISQGMVRAAGQGHIDIIGRLLLEGADANAPGVNGKPLWAAASSGHLEVVELLLQEGADVNACQIDGRTALHLAARSGHLAVVKLLLQGGADVNAWASFKGTALHAAARSGHIAVAKLLLQEGADINAQTGSRRTALHAAATNGHLEVVELLLQEGADINTIDRFRQTALQTAALGSWLEVADLLRAAGAKERNLSHGLS